MTLNLRKWSFGPIRVREMFSQAAPQVELEAEVPDFVGGLNPPDLSFQLISAASEN